MDNDKLFNTIKELLKQSIDKSETPVDMISNFVKLIYEKGVLDGKQAKD